MIGYIGLVYAFLGDWLIFDDVPTALTLLGVGVILTLNITVVCRNWEPAAPATEET